MIKRMLESLVSPLLHHTIKKRAVDKALKKESLNDRFVVIIPKKRIWQTLGAKVNDGDFQAKIQRSIGVIKNYGGEDTKVFDSLNDTRLYFRSVRGAIPAIKDAVENTVNGPVSVDEVKENDYK